MELSIQQISNGAPFMAYFNKVVVERCYYINARDERVEPTSILSSTTATMMRTSNHGAIYIKVFDKFLAKDFPFALFYATSAFYNKNEYGEYSETPMIRGNEIIEEKPINDKNFENGKINMFSISKQRGEIIAFLLINPQGVEDYYYRIMFRES